MQENKKKYYLDFKNKKILIKTSPQMTLQELRNLKKLPFTLQFLNELEVPIDIFAEKYISISEITNNKQITINLRGCIKETEENIKNLLFLQMGVMNKKSQENHNPLQDVSNKILNTSLNQSQLSKRQIQEPQDKLTKSLQLTPKTIDTNSLDNFLTPIQNEESKENVKQEDEKNNSPENNVEKNQNLLKGAIKIEQIDNLTIYSYPCYKLEELTPYEVQNLKTLVFMGQTGSGKTTMINRIANYYSGVKLSDKFRYKLTNKNIKEQKYSKNQDETESQTVNVKSYIVKPGPNTQDLSPLLLIDTPGFLDTEGKDHQIAADLKEFIKTQINSIDALCLVSVASNIKLTFSQSYVYNRVLEIFGKNIEKNIVNIFTFSDAGKPQILQSLKKEGIPHEFYYKFNNSALFEKSEEEEFYERLWSMGERSIRKLFQDLKTSFKPQNLQLTQNVIKEREKLENIVTKIKPKISQGLEQIKSAREELSNLIQNRYIREENKIFTTDVKQKIKVQDTHRQGIKSMNCKTCDSTCHYNCGVQYKEQCSVFQYKKTKRIICTICGCESKYHEKNNYYIREQQETVSRTDKFIKDKFKQADQKVLQGEQALQFLKEDFKKIIKFFMDNLDILQQTQESINKIAMKTSKNGSLDQIDLLIEEEKYNKKPGYQNQVKFLLDIKEHYNQFQKLLSEKKRDDYIEYYFQKEIEKQEQQEEIIEDNKKKGICTIF